MAHIQLKHVCKRYENGFEAVKDFNLEIQDNEFIIFVGPSGCGKSTTLRMIAGLENISEGELYIDGERMNEVEACDRDIAMVFQNYALYPHMTVRKNIGYSLHIRHEKKEVIEAKVNEAAEILGLTEVLDRKPSELSGGQRRRVAACSHGTRHRPQSQSLSDGRAPVQPGRQAPGTDAGGNRQPVS